jgi:hypothetical protein
LRGRIRDLKLNRPLGFLLHDDRVRSDPITVGDITDAQLQEIAAAQLAVERQIEQRELALAIAQFEANPNRPNVPEFERCFLPDQLSLVPEIAAARYNGGCQHLELLLFEGGSKREIHPIGGIPTGRQISMCKFDSAGLTRAYQRVIMTVSSPR